MKLLTKSLALFFFAAVHLAHANLLLDLQPVGGTTAAGYQAFEVTNLTPDGSGTDSDSYSAFGTTITVNYTTANLPDGSADFRAVARNGLATDVFNDWIGGDTRNTGVDVTLNFEFLGLPAGDYNWLSTHEDGGTGTTNGNLDGQADYSLTGSGGTETGVITQSIGNAPDTNLGSFATTFSSDGVNPVSFEMVMDNGQGGATGLFVYANAIEITSVIPEPSSMALLGFGFALLAFKRRRL